MQTIREVKKVARVMWAGAFDKELHQLITVFSANLEERTELVSLDERRWLLTLCTLKFFSQARTLRKVPFF